MINQKVVSSSEQADWFGRISSLGESHFIYYSHGADVGMLSIRQFAKTSEFEAGIFCGERSFLGHWINLSAAIGLYDYAFGQLGLRTAFAKVLADNKRAIRLNVFLGYKVTESPDEKVVRLNLSRENYYVRRSSRHVSEIPKMTLQTCT
jgi:RimJ/RimL family protein N-acetyltransferase